MFWGLSHEWWATLWSGAIGSAIGGGIAVLILLRSNSAQRAMAMDALEAQRGHAETALEAQRETSKTELEAQKEIGERALAVQKDEARLEREMAAAGELSAAISHPGVLTSTLQVDAVFARVSTIIQAAFRWRINASDPEIGRAIQDFGQAYIHVSQGALIGLKMNTHPEIVAHQPIMQGALLAFSNAHFSDNDADKERTLTDLNQQVLWANTLAERMLKDENLAPTFPRPTA